MSKIRSMLVDQSIVGEPERKGDERSEAPRSGGSPTIERAGAPAPPDPEVPVRHVRRRFTTAYKLEMHENRRLPARLQQAEAVIAFQKKQWRPQRGPTLS